MNPTALPALPEQKERPPHVEFELKPMEDREASMKAGRKIMKDQAFINIFPRGGKDRVRKIVPDAPTEGQYPTPQFQEFKERFGLQYDAWKQGLDAPVEGTDLKLFPLLTPAQIENCRTFHIHTVEQLAEANEETLQNIGMGSRNLKMTAVRWLEFGENGGKQVSRIEELEANNTGLEDQVKQLTAKVEELASQSDKDVNLGGTARAPGRPRKKK